MGSNKFYEIWEKTDYSNQFQELEDVLVGIYSESAKDRFLEGKKVVDLYKYTCGYWFRETVVHV